MEVSCGEKKVVLWKPETEGGNRKIVDSSGCRSATFILGEGKGDRKSGGYFVFHDIV